MLIKSTSLLWVITGLMISNGSLAEQENIKTPDNEKGQWSGEGEFGYTSTSGNSDSDTLSSKFGLGLKHNQWQHNVKIELLKTADNGVDSADSAVFTEKSEYSFSVNTFAFGRLRYEDDAFSGFDHQAVLSLGIGRVFLRGPIHLVEMSAGLGYKELEDDLGVLTQEVVFDGEFKYSYVISETAQVSQNILVESGESNTYSKSETFLKLSVSGNLSLKLSYEIKFNSDVPPNTQRVDKVTTVTLVYGF